jgi:ATP-dependent Lon protease
MTKKDDQASISLIADFDGDVRSLFNIKVDENIPILPLRNMVLFPGIIIPVAIERSFSKEVVNISNSEDKYIGVVCQKNSGVDTPLQKDMYSIGTVAKVVRILEAIDNKMVVLLQGFNRFKLKNVSLKSGVYYGEVEVLEEGVSADNNEILAISEACKESMYRILKLSDPGNDAAIAVKNIANHTVLINFIAANINIPVKEKIDLLRVNTEKARAYKLLKILNREFQFEALKARIQDKTREELDQQQREFFLQQQMKNIQDELGEQPADHDIDELSKKAAGLKLPGDVRKVFDRELKKLERINPQNPDYNVQLNYLQTVLSLPWGMYTNDNLDMKNAERTLNADHYGLEKVKERILEYLAVISLKKNLKSPILCLYGPPGVGKTSLGKSIAKALKRKYVRISLGGVHDESEIRGHRRTYIGAMPGRIIKNLAKCGSGNPVFVLDEIDKVSTQNINGDPSSALLEVLDPEQNIAFHDNFIDLDYDLSHVLFIATANTLSTIPAPLLDRMELIEVSGYITEEKLEIAKKYLIPKEKESNGLAKYKKLTISKPALEKIIEQYTRESGVRQLDNTINKIFRKVAYKIVKGEDFGNGPIKPDDVVKLLGQPPYIRDKYQGNDFAGVVTGLAWTSVGGEILYIETSLSEGKGNRLTLTGNLGDVMKESATLALEYVKAHADSLGIDHKIFDNWNIHIHVPEGAVPKDGPSAGITIATSIASALTQRKVRERTAMTGEITLRGKVLPVGGIKEKILAAKRAGITSIILSNENKKDISEINQIYLEGLNFEFVETVEDVFKLALLEEKVSNPVEFKIPEEKTEK